MGVVAHTDDVGSIIRDARKRLRYSQMELAALLGVKQQSVSQWEAGETLPALGTLVPLEDALELPRGELAVAIAVAAADRQVDERLAESDRQPTDEDFLDQHPEEP